MWEQGQGDGEAERLISRLATSVHHIGRGSTDPRKWQRQDSSWKPTGVPTGDSVYLGVVYRCSYLADVMTGCDMCSANLLRKIAQVYHSKQDKGKHFPRLSMLAVTSSSSKAKEPGAAKPVSFLSLEPPYKSVRERGVYEEGR
jgi:hypothetical protein